MRFLDSWKGWRKYKRLPRSFKKIVFYSESGQDWHFFEPLIRELLEKHGEKITYVSSDAGDPGLSLKHDEYTSVYIPEGLFLIIHFQVLDARLLVLTMMDLGNLQLKTSVNPVHYVYIFHSLGSTHMVDHADSYDAYRTLFCAGPHHVRELRRRESLAGLEPRNLFEYGHPRLEELIRHGKDRNVPREDSRPVALIAPTWGNDSIFNRCGQELVEALLAEGFHVIVRPHHHTLRLTPGVFETLLDQFAGHPEFESVTRMGETDSLFRSDILVCDWSAMAIEYFLGLEKPVLFIDLPRRVRNPDWESWDIEPLEAAIRDKAGAILDPGEMKRAGVVARDLANRGREYRASAARLREELIFNLGSSVPLGAAELVRIANEPGSEFEQDTPHA